MVFNPIRSTFLHQTRRQLSTQVPVRVFVEFKSQGKITVVRDKLFFPHSNAILIRERKNSNDPATPFGTYNEYRMDRPTHEELRFYQTGESKSTRSKDGQELTHLNLKKETLLSVKLHDKLHAAIKEYEVLEDAIETLHDQMHSADERITEVSAEIFSISK